jgi:hypothetical protein
MPICYTKEAGFIRAAGRTERKQRQIDTPYNIRYFKFQAPEYGTDVLEFLICVCEERLSNQALCG